MELQNILELLQCKTFISLKSNADSQMEEKCENIEAEYCELAT